MTGNISSAQVNSAEYVDASMNELSRRQEFQFGTKPEPPRNTSCCQWTPPVVIDTSRLGAQIGGYMALDDSGNIYVTWAGFTGIVIERSTNRGDTWTRSEYNGPELSRTPKDIEVDHNGVVWILWHSVETEFSPTYLNLSKSADRGQTFTSVFRSRAYAGSHLYSKLAIDAHNSIYMLWDDAQFKLTKFRNGDVAQRTDALIPNDTLRVDFHPDLAISSDFVVDAVWEGLFYDPNTGYHEFVFCSSSTDSGLSFRGRTRVDTADVVGSSYVHHYPSSVVDCNGTIFVSYTRELTVNRRDIRFTKSTDGGIGFGLPIIISDSTSYESLLCIDSSQGGINILFGSPLGTMHRRSNDGGITFAQSLLVGGIGPRSVKASRDGFLYTSGESGLYVFFTKTNLVTSVRVVDVTPNQFELLNNYPNPFNSMTQISFGFPASPVDQQGLRFVSLKVYNILGQEVATLVNEEMERGSYQRIFDASGLASGVYLYRLSAGSSVEIKKMVVAR